MFDDHHGELAELLLDQITSLDAKIGRLGARAAGLTAAMPAAWGINADGTTGPGAGTGPDAPVLNAAARLAEIPGISEDLARAIIAETGLDMTRFPTAAHLVSWAGLCPSARQSGPRTRAGKKGQGDTWLRGSLGQAAIGAARTATFLGERYHRIARRRGKGKAQVAVARSILGQVAGTRCRAPAPSEPDLPVSRHPAQASHSGHCGLQRRCAPALPGLAGEVAGGVHQGCGGFRVPLAVPTGPSRPAGCGLDVLAGGAHPPVLPLLRGAGQVAGVEQVVSA
jgi:transposase